MNVISLSNRQIEKIGEREGDELWCGIYDMTIQSGIHLLIIVCMYVCMCIDMIYAFVHNSFYTFNQYHHTQ